MRSTQSNQYIRPIIFIFYWFSRFQNYIVNPPDRKLVNPTSVQWIIKRTMLMQATVRQAMPLPDMLLLDTPLLANPLLSYPLLPMPLLATPLLATKKTNRPSKPMQAMLFQAKLLLATPLLFRAKLLQATPLLFQAKLLQATPLLAMSLQWT